MVHVASAAAAAEAAAAIKMWTKLKCLSLSRRPRQDKLTRLNAFQSFDNHLFEVGGGSSLKFSASGLLRGPYYKITMF